jgi:ABC-type nitrate/sulfonate/bicarbonate transport system substrate-binding protein
MTDHLASRGAGRHYCLLPFVSCLVIAFSLTLAACGGGTTAPASAAALEKTTLRVGVAGTGISAVPLHIAFDQGYFKNHGLNVTISNVGGAVGNQAIVSGSLDVDHGSASMITAHLAGADSIYMAAPTNNSPNVLFGKKGLNSVADLRGKTVSLAGPGTTRDIFLHAAARKAGMEVGKDVQALYSSGDPVALAAFLSGQSDAALVAPPASTQLRSEGYPVLLDFPKEGLHVIEPGMIVNRAVYQKNPNTFKAYLEAYLDGVKRALDDPTLAKQTEAHTANVDDQAVLDSDYQLGVQAWNKNMAIDPADIQLVLDALPDEQKKNAQPAEFYDNTYITAVNREYAAKLFPGQVS